MHPRRLHLTLILTISLILALIVGMARNTQTPALDFSNFDAEWSWADDMVGDGEVYILPIATGLVPCRLHPPRIATLPFFFASLSHPPAIPPPIPA